MTTVIVPETYEAWVDLLHRLEQFVAAHEAPRDEFGHPGPLFVEVAATKQSLVDTKEVPGRGAFLWYQRLELGRARDKHGTIQSLHAAYAIILEELDEFWEEVRKQEAKRDVPKMVEELTQIAAMCQRTFEDLKLNERYRPR